MGRGPRSGLLTKGWFSKRVVLADVPPERKPERGYIRMFPQNENRNEGTFGCSPGTKTRTRVRSDDPPEKKGAVKTGVKGGLKKVHKP